MFTNFINLILTQYGLYAFLIIFLIIFVETGLVFFPFLPGDSLLFMTGAFIAKSAYNPILFSFILAVAAILGDFVNYSLGRKYGLSLRKVPFFGKFIKDSHIAETEHFFLKYGNIAISLGRFVPIVRTFIPFISGIGKMDTKKFFIFNCIGGLSWVIIGILAGFFFGSIPFVKAHFELIMLAIVFVSVLPIIFMVIKRQMNKA
ncbi:VTT domain-containing protein [Streptococcus parauberis]|uniref:SNARE-like domain protein n=2 Tax=Streptococcus parauberis TaxID=1348 RepID=F1Z2M6_9STRE|nr:VTT domain-containing protein [Streptococcus parauberis]EGE54798.1 SNARE-like domain protein [Streptococcus parauberis NCFD 2020]OHY29465.1 cytochrome O ubiquinol oxidase [Streptococcus parauberis]PCH12803.1 Inner membrane protein YqjA [Streptococcus parauberis]PNY22958.1 Inner membrane protein YqjA [Streptococcus parauberis]